MTPERRRLALRASKHSALESARSNRLRPISPAVSTIWRRRWASRSGLRNSLQQKECIRLRNR